MSKPTVSLVKYCDVNSVGEAISLCSGFSALKTSDKVLLKPNICGHGAGIMPPYAMVTTTAVLEGAVRALHDYGVTDITIADGAAMDDPGVSTTEMAFSWTKLDRLAKKYGVKLVDLNRGPFREITVENLRMEIAEAALAADFFINVPVLKSHYTLRVSIAGKNLKGCLSIRSKRFFHRDSGDTLEHRISLLVGSIPQHLVLVDGIYAMAKGPDALLGIAHPKGILVASTDFLAADAIGTRLLGGKPTEVEYLRLYAQRNNRMDVMERPDTVDVMGEPLETHCAYLPWHERTCSDTLKAAGHKGIEFLGSDAMCTGCFGNMLFSTTALSALSRNGCFGDIVILSGRNITSDQNSPKTILFGNCAIKGNKRLDKAVRVDGCPPDMQACLKEMVRHMRGVHRRTAFFIRIARFMKKSRKGIGWFPVPTWKGYENNPEFDLKYYRTE
jgi:uncharacterized protein (DUF362 family)